MADITRKKKPIKAMKEITQENYIGCVRIAETKWAVTKYMVAVKTIGDIYNQNSAPNVVNI